MARRVITNRLNAENNNNHNHNYMELYNQRDEFLANLNMIGNTVDKVKTDTTALLTDTAKTLQEAKNINAANQDVQKQLDTIILENSTGGNTDAEVVQARGDYPLLKDRINHLEESNGVNPELYGFSELASWQTNRDAVQKANDELKKLGGGVINLPSGTFEIKGVFQDSNVFIRGNQTVLKHPDGQSQDIISSRLYSTDGSSNTQSFNITVKDASNIQKGSLVALKGAGGASPFQNTRLSIEMTSAQTTLSIENTTGFHTNGVLWIDDELVEYSGISGNTLTGVTRGLYGTNASSHSTGAKVSIALRHIAGVTNVEGNTVTLDKAPVKSVTNANILIGVINPVIKDVIFDGNLNPEGPFLACNPVKWNLVRFGSYDFIAKNAESAIYLNNTCDTDGVVYGENITKPKGTIGSGVWLFQNCHRNSISANFTGDTWVGVYLDNRTSKGTEFDGPCDFNNGSVIVNSDYYDKGHTTTGLSIVGGNHNSFSVKTFKVHTGFSIKNEDQIYNIDGVYPDAKGNRVNYNVLSSYQPHVVYATGNTIMGYHESQTEGYLYDGSLKLASSFKSGEIPKLGPFENGTYNSPSINFRNSLNTGFYLVADGQVQFVSNSDSLVRFRSTGLFFADGKNLEFNTNLGNKIGTSSSQKIGFWGATPVTQPPKIGTIASSASQEDIANQLNLVIKALRDIGIISNV